jgi:hypothetical protein
MVSKVSEATRETEREAFSGFEAQPQREREREREVDNIVEE